ncbi:uncharacterized protein [Eurosta solidaginis]|uniref:uncharacterized protein n=1 Tax=Eurosta solidaginis TaxID=178769 RepID=UPI0035311DA2
MNTVRRWDVHFTGGETLYDFLERIEELAECYSIPLDRLLPTLPETLRGKALQWFRVRKAEIPSWAQFRTAAEQFFLPRRHLHQLEDAIRQRRQQGREKAKDYILTMQTMIRQHPIMSRENYLERIYDGLRVEYRLFAKRSEFRTIEELMELTDEFELLQLEATRQSRQTAHSLSPLTEEYSREESCWRCKERGHMRHQCRKARRLFCSRCGRDNVMSRDCRCDNASTLTTVRLRHGKIPQSAAIDEQPLNEKMDGRHYVKLTIEGLNVRALVDTGATLTYVGDTIRKHLEGKKIACAPSVRNVQLADRTCVVSSYTYQVTILCNNKPTHMRVSTLPNLAEYMILGMDFLRERGLTLTLDGNLLPPATPTQNTIIAKLSTVTEGKHLRATQNAERAVFLNHHQRIFGGITGPSRAAEHVISLKHDRPLKQRYCPRNSAMQQIKNAEVDEHRITHNFTAAYAPHETPTERANRVIKTMIAQRSKADHRTWNREVPQTAFTMNTAHHEATQALAAEINFGRSIETAQQIRTEGAVPEESPTVSPTITDLREKINKNLAKADYDASASPTGFATNGKGMAMATQQGDYTAGTNISRLYPNLMQTVHPLLSISECADNTTDRKKIEDKTARPTETEAPEKISENQKENIRINLGTTVILGSDAFNIFYIFF